MLCDGWRQCRGMLVGERHGAHRTLMAPCTSHLATQPQHRSLASEWHCAFPSPWRGLSQPTRTLARQPPVRWWSGAGRPAQDPSHPHLLPELTLMPTPSPGVRGSQIYRRLLPVRPRSGRYETWRRRCKRQRPSMANFKLLLGGRARARRLSRLMCLSRLMPSGARRSTCAPAGPCLRALLTADSGSTRAPTAASWADAARSPAVRATRLRACPHRTSATRASPPPCASCCQQV